jgi:cell division protein ZapA
MARVVLKLNGRDFALTCTDGQEPRLRLLAQYVDGKIGEFAKNLGQVGEARLMLLAALAIADELSDANDALRQERARARDAAATANQGANDGASDGENDRTDDATTGAAIKSAASSIDEIAQRIESIAVRIETP